MSKRDDVGFQRVILLVFLAIALYACYGMLKPYLEPIILAILIGLLAQPVHQRLVKVLRGRQSTAAVISCLLLMLVILIPTLILLGAILKQGINYSVIVKEWATQDNIQQFLSHPWLVESRDRLTSVLPDGALDPDNIRSKALAVATVMGKQFAGVSTSILGSMTRLVFNFMLLLFVLFFVLRDQSKLVAFIHRALPLARTQEETLFKEVKVVSKSALLGTFLTAITQGVVGGLGLWIAGFPGVFWGAVMALTSLIPLVGTALVWLPAAIFLMFTGEWNMAIFMLVWGIVVVGSIDNFLRPLLMQGADMSTVVIFFSLIGGLQVFGIAGLIYGPLIFAVALVLFRLYEIEFSQFLDSQDNS